MRGNATRFSVSINMLREILSHHRICGCDHPTEFYFIPSGARPAVELCIYSGISVGEVELRGVGFTPLFTHHVIETIVRHTFFLAMYSCR